MLTTEIFHNRPQRFPLRNECLCIGFLLLVLHLLLLIPVAEGGLLFPVVGKSGGYLGYDNYNRFWNGGGTLDISHPLYNLFTIANGTLLRLFSLKAVLSFNLLLTNLLITAGHLCVYLYLRTVLRLNRSLSLIALLSVVSSFTTLTLSFTIESYPFSYFLLSLSLLILGREKTALPNKRWHFLTIAIGSVTITNIAKPLLALFWLTPGSLHKRSQSIFRTCLIFVAMVCAVILLYSGYALYKGEPDKLPWRVAHRETFVYRDYQPKHRSDFLLHALAAPRLEQRRVANETTLRPGDYPKSPISAAVSSLWIIAGLLGWWELRRTSNGKIIASYAFIDFIIHFIAGYGMQEAVIFGGHWVMLLPICLGGLLQRCSSNSHPSSSARAVWLYACPLFFLLLGITQGLLNIEIILQAFSH
ncbi:MAG: DUF6080 domain-containing protein [Porphyromonas sp.]|nr:DUF6080 domain-containing protein [Porphyromonas sp.]